MKAKILVIEDDVQVTAAIRQTLECAGYQVIDAVDGDRALRIFRLQPVQLVIIDIILFGKNGLEVIQEIKAGYPEAKMITMSAGGGEPDDALLKAAKDLGADRTFLKPFYPHQMLEAVEQLLCET